MYTRPPFNVKMFKCKSGQPNTKLAKYNRLLSLDSIIRDLYPSHVYCIVNGTKIVEASQACKGFRILEIEISCCDSEFSIVFLLKKKHVPSSDSFYWVSLVDPSDLWLAGRSTRWYTDQSPWPPCCVVRASVAPNNVPNGQKRARGICATAPVVDLGWWTMNFGDIYMYIYSTYMFTYAYTHTYAYTYTCTCTRTYTQKIYHDNRKTPFPMWICFFKMICIFSIPCYLSFSSFSHETSPSLVDQPVVWESWVVGSE